MDIVYRSWWYRRYCSATHRKVCFADWYWINTGIKSRIQCFCILYYTDKESKRLGRNSTTEKKKHYVASMESEMSWNKWSPRMAQFYVDQLVGWHQPELASTWTSAVTFRTSRQTQQNHAGLLRPALCRYTGRQRNAPSRKVIANASCGVTFADVTQPWRQRPVE